jgi:hypothetical protein
MLLTVKDMPCDQTPFIFLPDKFSPLISSIMPVTAPISSLLNEMLAFTDFKTNSVSVFEKMGNLTSPLAVINKASASLVTLIEKLANL